VVIHDLDLVCAVLAPYETHPPVVVNSDAVLSPAVTFQRFELVARRNSQTGQLGGRVKLQKLAARNSFDIPEPRDRPTTEERFCIGTRECADHLALCSALRIL
jgi:hypothetical protein